ncbi:MAG: hypothetical protein ACFFD4_12340 [Candidatus Odinarchaeota archaeon]
MSPHRAWQTDEGLVLHNRTLIANINRISEGKLPLEESVVDLEKKY